MRAVRGLWRLVTRWYVSIVLVTALGVAVGYFAFFNLGPGRPQIGIIDIPFTVIDEDSAFVISQMLNYARRNDSIKAVVVKLTTPGGGAADSERLYLEMARLREEKPVVIATGWISASGGALMSMGANYVFAESSSFLGSIGVVVGLAKPQPPEELLVSSGPAKLTGGTNRTFTAMMEFLKDSFIDTVISERGDRLKMTEAQLAEARLYVGLEAVQLGLIDAIGSESDAVEKSADLAGVSNYDLVNVNERVLREFVLQQERIFDTSVSDQSEFEMSDVASLRAMTSAARGTDGQTGTPANFPVEVNLPGMYYLYVAPTE